MRANKKKSIALVTGAAVVILAAAGAYAYWTAGGDGTGTATTGTGDTDLVVVQTSTVTEMGPGVAPQTLSGNFNNGNDGPSYVGAVEVSVASTSNPGCDAGDYVITGSPMTVEAEIPAGNAVGAWTGAQIAFQNTAENQDACKGATVNLEYTINNTPAP